MLKHIEDPCLWSDLPQTGMPGFIHKFHLQNIYIITIFSLIAYSSWMLPLCLAQMRIVFTVGSCSLWCPVIKIILSPTTHICQSGSLQDKPLRYRICFLQASPLTRFLGSNTHVIFAVLSLFFVWSKDLNRLGPNRSTLPRFALRQEIRRPAVSIYLPRIPGPQLPNIHAGSEHKAYILSFDPRGR